MIDSMLFIGPSHFFAPGCRVKYARAQKMKLGQMRQHKFFVFSTPTGQRRRRLHRLRQPDGVDSTASQSPTLSTSQKHNPTHPNHPSNRLHIKDSISEKNGMTSEMRKAITHDTATIATHEPQPTSVFECRCSELRKTRKKMKREETDWGEGLVLVRWNGL